MLRLEQVITADGEDPIDLTIPPGDGLALIGPSGGARSRLLRAVAGLTPPHGGRITFDGAPVQPLQAGFVDEDRSVLGALTAAENVATRVLMRTTSRNIEPAGIDALLRRLGLPESSWHNLAEQLSGGQQQRVALARALYGTPSLLCLDDPVSELDDASATLIWTVLADTVRDGATLLVGLPHPDPRAPVSSALTMRRPEPVPDVSERHRDGRGRSS